MDRLRRTLSFRSRKKKRKYQTESTKPHQWQEDEKKVRDGTCSFQVKYLGCVEVFESRGMQVCEEAHKVLRSNSKKSHRLSFRKKPKNKQKAVQAILYISGDSLRVVEDKAGITSTDDTQGLIVDQTIEKVSFCAPDREHEKGFSYICRDGTTRRWMCHGFLALKESSGTKISGERLSHAVGCAFAVCLEKKQKREKEAVTVNYSEDKTSFSRLGSFRQATLTERLADPQSTKVVEAQPQAAKADVEFAQVERPRASQDLLLRQGSFREFTKLNSQTSPFKRNLSLRLNELPSNVSRQQADFNTNVPIIEGDEPDHATAHSPPQTTESKNKEFDPIAEMCQQLSQGITGLSDENKNSTVTNVTTVNNKVTNLASASNTTSAINGVKAAQDPIDPWAKDTDLFTPSTTKPAAQAEPSSPALQPQPVNTTSSTVRPRPMAQTQLSNQSSTGFNISTNQTTPKNNTVPQKYAAPNGHSLGPSTGPTSPLNTQNNPNNPFDTTWAIKTSANNPFLTNTQTTTQTTTTTNANHHQFSKEFELKM